MYNVHCGKLLICEVPILGFVRRELEVAAVLGKVLGFSKCS
jgi:hypothetical protein